MPPSPSARRIASLIWFPFIFVAFFATMGLFAFSHPAPHDLPVRVVGSSAEAQAIQHELDHVRQGGFVVTAAESAGTARTAVETGDAVAAYVPATVGAANATSEAQNAAAARVLVAPASSASQATYLTTVFTAVATRAGDTAERVDVVSPAAGDVSGISLMFVGLPLTLVGLIATLVLLQFGAWRMRAKIVTIAAVGLFGSVFVYLLATAMDVIPHDEWIILFGFMLTQAIGWLALGAAYFTRQFFLPVIMTFVLILGLPTAGATVAGDMLPTPLGWLNDVLPFAQFVRATHAGAYFGGHGLAWPVTLLGLWMLAGSGLVLASSRHALRAARRAQADLLEGMSGDDPTGAARGLVGRVHGTIALETGRPVTDAVVVILTRTGDELARGNTSDEGHFAIDDVPVGVHTMLATADHCDPVVTTIDVREGPEAPSRRITLVDWTDPSGNLVAAGLDRPLVLTASDAGSHHPAHHPSHKAD